MRLLTPEEAAARGGRGGGGGGGGAGLVVFQRDCQACHGADRSGTPNGASLVGVAGRLSAEEMRSTVAERQGPYAADCRISLLSDIDAVVAYLAAADTPGRGGRGRGADAAAPALPPGPVVQSGPAVVAHRWRRSRRAGSRTAGVSGGRRGSSRTLHDERLRSLLEHRPAAVHDADVVRSEQGHDQVAGAAWR